MFEKIFSLAANKTNTRTEVLAGITTFMTMAYILAVNPQILSEAGLDKGGVFTATILASVIAMTIMAFYANLPVALAPGWGSMRFLFTPLCSTWDTAGRQPWQHVFIEGLIFILMSFFNIREAIIDSIPASLKNAISAGIGLFIALIGLNNSGIITSSPSTLVVLGDLTNPSAYLTVAGIILAAILLVFKVRGALLLSIVVITLAGIPAGITLLPESHIVSLPPSPEKVFMKMDFSGIFTGDMIVVVLTFLFVDVFDTVGTLLGVCNKAGMVDSNGKVPKAKQALLSDAIGTTAGAMLGTSTITSYVESASGIAEGGRTGMTTLVVACLFLGHFFWPLFS
jgi:AGZA family xanthine/uracil permease-like MFS transporter